MRQPLPTSQKNLTVACWKVWFTDAGAISLNPTRGTTQWSFQVYRLDRKKPWMMHDSARTLKQFHCGFQFKVWFFGLLCSCSPWIPMMWCAGLSFCTKVESMLERVKLGLKESKKFRCQGRAIVQGVLWRMKLCRTECLVTKRAEQRTGWIQFVFDLIPCLQRDDLPIPRVQFYLFTKLFW